MISDLNCFIPNLFLFDEYSFAITKATQNKGIENPLKYVYGIIRCKWAFNYDSFIKMDDNEYAEMLLKEYCENNIIPVLNFSKTNVESEDLDDKFCNFLLDKANENKGEVIVASDILFNYIKSKYPDMKITSSVNLPIYKFQTEEVQNTYNPQDELNFYNDLSKKYDRVIIRPEFVKYIEQGLLPENTEKMILIVNSSCKSNCNQFDKCFNCSDSKFICCQKADKENLGIEKALENIIMLSNTQIENLKEKGFTNYILKDNKQSLLFLYPLFNSFLFSEDNNVNLNLDIKTEIKENIMSNKYSSAQQILLFGSTLRNTMNYLDN